MLSEIFIRYLQINTFINNKYIKRMKKSTLLFGLFLLTLSNLLNAQNCTPDYTGYTSVPDTGIMLPHPLPVATVNEAYQQTVTIGVPSKVIFQSAEAPLNWIKLLSVSSSLGNTWTVLNDAGGTTFPQWNKLTWQCVTLTGTPTHTGTDSISVMVDAEVVVFSQPWPVENQVGGKLALVIQQPQFIANTYTDNNVSVSPNPSKDGIYNLLSDESYTMNICDITGKTIQTNLIEKGVIAIDISDKPSGVYFIQLKNDSQSNVIRILKN